MGRTLTEEESRRVHSAVRFVEGQPAYQLARRENKRLPEPAGAGGSADIILFEFDSFVYGMECEACNATVILEGCGTSAGSSVEVADEMGCFFNVPEDMLVGKRGMAAKMKGGDGYSGCQWVVFAMCCTGE